MRVVHIVKVTGIAGAERHLLMLLTGLRTRDIDARIIVLVEPDKPVDDFIEALQERDIPAQRLVIHHDLDVTLYWRLYRALRELKPDIVHTHLWHADFFGIMAARFALFNRIISSRHNDDAFRHQAVIRFANRILWWLTSAGIAISDAIRQFSIDVEKVPPEKIHTVRYGMEYDPSTVDRQVASQTIHQELNLPVDAPLVGMVCRLTEQKGIQYGLRAFARIVPDFPQAQFLIAGDGPLRDELQTEVQALDITEQVHFLGWRNDIPTLMGAFDVFLMPSLWEGFGLVMLEAMAQQTPIIGSAVSAIPEVIADGETGFLVPPRDVEALAGALYLLLHDRVLARYMGLLGQDRLETHFSMSRMVEETIAIYEAVSSHQKG